MRICLNQTHSVDVIVVDRSRSVTYSTSRIGQPENLLAIVAQNYSLEWRNIDNQRKIQNETNRMIVVESNVF